MQTRDVDYRCEEVNLRGYLAWNESSEPRPGVLVFHEGLGLGDFAMERARRLAALGYVAFAADMFGERRQARNLQEVATLVGGLRAEPTRLRARGRAALDALASLPQVDPQRLAAIGFCFGGSVVLELARAGADLRAVVSFHGVLATKLPAVTGAVKASVLVLTGADDPLAPPDQVADFENEMRLAASAGLAGHQLRQHDAWFHQPRGRRYDAAHRALQCASRPPLMGVDAKPVR